MKAMILAGGFGSRLSEETTSRPKPMVEVGGRPILWHIMNIYAAHGITEFVVCLGYKADYIKNYFVNYNEYISNDFIFKPNGKSIELLSSDADDYLKRDIDIFLGDLYRRQGNFEQAVATYSKILDQSETLSPSDWSLVYARAISYEKLEEWHKAELDLLTAIDLNPENAMVLNYLGYSWADRGMHLERALNLIEKAVALEPNDPYILDSYGWVLYRTGKFEEAVNWLERAAEQMPNDATINDHLGDAYWQVGRYDEAKTQWLRSTRLKPADDLLSSIENKLKHGLTTERILEQEARLQ